MILYVYMIVDVYRYHIYIYIYNIYWIFNWIKHMDISKQTAIIEHGMSPLTLCPVAIDFSLLLYLLGYLSMIRLES